MFKCSICNDSISDERLEGLQFLGVFDPNKMTCLKCAEQLVQKTKGIYLGESGNSPLLFVKSVSNTDGIDKNNQ